MTFRTLTAACAAVAALLVAAPLAAAQTAPPADPDPPSVLQLCAATGVEELDSLLEGVARTELVDALAPLLDLTVPESETVEIDGSVQLDDVRTALNCEPDPTPTPSPTPEPADPETPAPVDEDDVLETDVLDDDGPSDLPDAPTPTVVDDGVAVTG